VVPAALPTKPASLTSHPPAAASGWQAPLASTDPGWKPEFIGAHSEWRAAYRDPESGLLELRAIGYASQEQNGKLVSARNSLLGTGGLTAAEVRSVDRRRPPRIEILASDPQGRRFCVWAIHDIDGRRFATPLFSQLWYGLRSVAGAAHWMLFAHRIACEPTCEAARTRRAAFEPNVARDAAVTSGTS
jgi:hypothetical protein